MWLCLVCTGVDKMEDNVCKSEIFAGNRGAELMIYVDNSLDDGAGGCGRMRNCARLRICAARQQRGIAETTLLHSSTLRLLSRQTRVQAANITSYVYCTTSRVAGPMCLK